MPKTISFGNFLCSFSLTVELCFCFVSTVTFDGGRNRAAYFSVFFLIIVPEAEEAKKEQASKQAADPRAP